MGVLKRSLPFVAVALFLLPLTAQAAALSIVNVAAPAINCVFNTTCIVTVNDSIGDFTPPGDGVGARLQSRTYPGMAPAPADGDMAYVYRVDLTQVQAGATANCVTKLAFDFGRVSKQPYSPTGMFDIFVVTSGGLGSVALSSAKRIGRTVTITFAQPVCPGATSYFFGFASKTTTPVVGKATLFYSLGGSETTDVRVP